MKIVNETELMTNQKASRVIVPDKVFEALQTIEGNALLFSIGVDNILYCTREAPGDIHGWVRIDLSSALSGSMFNGATVIAKDFSVAQDLSSVNTIDIALVVTANDQDHLLLATGFSNTLANWIAGPPRFTTYAFDDYANMSIAGSPINDVQIADGNGSQYIIADLITNPTLQTITRYYIDTGFNGQYPQYKNPVTKKGCAWVPHNLEADLQAGQITTLLGCGPVDGPNGTDIGGAYVLGTIANTAQLIYAPSFNADDISMYQEPTVFVLPEGTDASHMAMALSAPGATAPYTDLFFASNGVLYFLANEDQLATATYKPTPVAIYNNTLFNNIQSLHISNWNDTIMLWGQSVNPDDPTSSVLFVMEGVAGQETNADAWSYPIPLLFGVENSTTYINNQLNNNVIFAEQADGTLVQLFQDPVTTAWQERSLLTEPVNYITEIYETTTYSTHIEITDDNNTPQLQMPVYVWASSPCSVYVTDYNVAAACQNTGLYQALAFDQPLKLTTDNNGTITIMQPVDTIGGISYYVAVQDPNTQAWYTQAINPLSATAGNLSTKVPDSTGNHLDVDVQDEYGNSAPLVSSGDITEEQKTAASNSIYAFCQHNSDMNSDGLTTDQKSWPDPATAINTATTTVKAVSPAAVKPRRRAKDVRFNPAKGKIWAVTFGQDAKYYEGADAVKEMGITFNADNSFSVKTANGKVLESSSWIDAEAGHLFKWMQSEAHKLKQIVMNWAEDGLDCLLTIGEEVYHFVVKCMNDIANAIHTALNAIKTAFKDLVAWIGMLFNFQDILRTHSVLKSVINVYLDYCRTEISTLNTDITDVFNQLEGQVDPDTGLPATGLPDATQTYGGAMQTGTSPKGSKSPSANYGSHHFKNNAGNSDHSYTPDTSGILDGVFDDLLAMIENEGTAFTDAGNQIKDAIAQITDGKTPFTTILSNVMKAVKDLLLNTAEDFLQTLVSVFQTLLDNISNVMNATLHIPVLTYLYKKMTVSKEFPEGQDLSALDLSCLISAIPVTVIYKLVKGSAPFPAGTVTDNIIAATDMDSLAAAVSQLESVSSTDPGLLGHGLKGNMTPLNIAGSLSAVYGAIAVDLCLLVKANLPPEMDDDQTFTNKLFSCLNAVGYMQYLLPDLITAIQTWSTRKSLKWYDTMNNICTCIGGGKTLIDAGSAWFTGSLSDTYGKFVSPISDFLLNVAWQVPTVFTLLEQVKEPGKWVAADVNAIVSCVGGSAFDMSGIASPCLAECYFLQQKPEVNAWVLAISILNVVWGASCMVTTFDGLPIPQ